MIWRTTNSIMAPMISTCLNKIIKTFELISFFKPRIMALDRFWENAKFVFDVL